MNYRDILPRGKGGVRRVTAALALMALMASACGGESSDVSTDQGDGALQKVVVGLTTCSGYNYAYHVADELGFFEEEGLDVELQCLDGSTAVAQQLAAGNVTVGAASATAMFSSKEHGVSFYPFFVTAWGGQAAFEVPAESDIQSIAELKGKAVAVSELSGGEVTTVKALAGDAGLDPENDITLIEVGNEPAQLQIAIERDLVQAIGASVSGLAVYHAAGIETKSLLSEEQMARFAIQPSSAMYVTEEYADDTELLASFARAAAKGFLTGYTNPRATVCIVAERVPEEFVEPELGRAGYESSRNVTTAPLNSDGTYGFSAEIENVDLWNEVVQLMEYGGVVEEAYDMQPYIIDVRDKAEFDQQEVIEEAETLESDCEAVQEWDYE